MAKEKTPTHLLRKVRTYKAVEDVYLKACERAKSEGTSLTNIIEAFLIDYATNVPAASAKKAKAAPKKKASKPKAKPQLQDYDE